MKKYISTLFVLLLLFVIPQFGQTRNKKNRVVNKKEYAVIPPKQPDFKYTPSIGNCNIKSVNFDPIRDLRIGMTDVELKKVFPNLELKSFLFDIERGIVRPLANAEYKEIEFIDVFLFENKLASFELWYIPEIEWTSINEFTHQFATMLRLPSDIGSFYDDYDKPGVAVALWKDFQISATLAGINYRGYSIVYRNNSSNKKYSIKVEKRDFFEEAFKKSEAEKERQKKQFKP